MINTFIACAILKKTQQLSFLKKLDIELPNNSAISLLGTYPKELKAGNQTDICTPMFIAALFIIAKRWKQVKCPSTDEWIVGEEEIFLYPSRFFLLA